MAKIICKNAIVVRPGAYAVRIGCEKTCPICKGEAYTESEAVERTTKPQWHHRWRCSCGMSVDSPIGGGQQYCSDCGCKLDYSDWLKECEGMRPCGEHCYNCKVVNDKEVQNGNGA